MIRTSCGIRWEPNKLQCYVEYVKRLNLKRKYVTYKTHKIWSEIDDRINNHLIGF